MALRRVLRACGLLILALAFAIGALEVLYRIQLIDTYKPELLAYNPEQVLTGEREASTMLMMGDSFTAGAAGGYVADLRQALPDIRIVNAGISGTGIVQANIVARERFARFHPRILIYQVYVGNDLFDIRYPVNWARVSFVRNMYWLIASRIRAIAFVNYRLGQMRYQASSAPAQWLGMKQVDQPFSVSRYDSRVLTYFKAEPELLKQSIFVEGRRAADFAVLTRGIHSLLARCIPGACSAYILVIPHCAQVSSSCLEHMRALGATVDDSMAIEGAEYPFVTGLRAALRDVPNASVLNPLATLRAAQKAGVAVYHTNDEHLTQAGDQVLAEFLVPIVRAVLDPASGGQGAERKEATVGK